MQWPDGQLATCVVLIDLILILLGSDVCRHRHCIHYALILTTIATAMTWKTVTALMASSLLVNQVYDSIQYTCAYEI